MEALVILAIIVVFVLPIVAVVMAARALHLIRRLDDEVRRLSQDQWELRTRQPGPPPPIVLRPAPPEARSEPAAAPEAETTGSRPPAAAAAPPVSEAAERAKAFCASRHSEAAPEEKTTAAAPLPPLPTETPPLEAMEADEAGEPRAGARRIRLEEQLGARLPVWLGSIALFLAGTFLVKYTFDKGLLTPATRVAIGAVFGLLLLGAGEWLRRRAARIAQGITAAGVADLFACALAAANLYHLVGRTTGFGLLAATAALAVVLSLRQGPFVALLGLVGGFLTPALIGATEPQPGPLFVYLFLLQVGLLVVVRGRDWWPLASLTFAGALAWTIFWLATAYRPQDSAWIGPFLILSIAAYVAAMFQSESRAADRHKVEHVFAVLGAVVGMVVLAALVRTSDFSLMDWAFLWILSAATLLLARLDDRYQVLAWIVAAMGAVLLAVWAEDAKPVAGATFAQIALALGGLHAAGGYAAHWKSKRAAYWASQSGAAAVAYLLVCYWAVPELPLGWRWGVVCLVVAAIYVLFAVPRAMRPAEQRRGDAALAALLTAATAFVSLAAPIELERAWISVAWSIEIPALAIIAGWLCVPALRVLAGILAAAVVVSLFRPGVLEAPLGENPVFDWILYGYGIPAATFAAGAWLFRRQGARRLVELLEAGTALLVFTLVTLKVRRWFHPGELLTPEFAFDEWATYVNAWLLLGLAGLALARGTGRIVARGAGQIFSLVGATAAVLALCLAFNPLWREQPIAGLPLLNALLYLYGLPTALMLILATRFFQREDTREGKVLAVVGLLLLFVLVSLEVRHFFQGALLNRPGLPLREIATYANAWFVLGAGILIASRRWRSEVLSPAGHIVALLAAVTATLGLALMYNPLWSNESVGATPVLNDLLYLYGLPAALAGGLAALFSAWRDRPQARAAAGVGLFLLFVLVSLEVRQFFHPESLNRRGMPLREIATYANAWFVLGAGILIAGRRRLSDVLSPAGHIVLLLAAATGVFGPGLMYNPVWLHESVGAMPVINHLLYVYGLPAVLAAALAAMFSRWRQRPQARAAGTVGLVMLFLLVTLSVRQVFRGEFLDAGAPSSAESYAYSAAWALLGTLLLVSGIVTRGLVLRCASLIVMLLAVGKVFIFDTAHLRDLYRVFSLLGLGACLLILAFLYQRFVFSKRDALPQGDRSK